MIIDYTGGAFLYISFGVLYPILQHPQSLNLRQMIYVRGYTGRKLSVNQRPPNVQHSSRF
jgi:hypothetical protein